MRIKACGYSNAGGRKENEDSYGIRDLENGLYAVVADGLGSHGGGKQASGIAVRHLAGCGDGENLPDAGQIMSSLAQANEEIFRCRENASHMKTTVVFLGIKDGQAVWMHIGDSRLYHYHNGELKDFTLDHSVSQLAAALGEITRREIPGHAERSRLLRVLGDEELKPDICGPAFLEPGDHAFLLCTDGFWEYVSEDEMLSDLGRSASPGEWLSAMRGRLVRRAGEKNDNHTAVAVFAEGV